MALTPSALIAVSCAWKSLSPSEYFWLSPMTPPSAVNGSMKYLVRPTL
jgi:hypothetical protein